MNSLLEALSDTEETDKAGLLKVVEGVKGALLFLKNYMAFAEIRRDNFLPVTVTPPLETLLESLKCFLQDYAAYIAPSMANTAKKTLETAKAQLNVVLEYTAPLAPVPR